MQNELKDCLFEDGGKGYTAKGLFKELEEFELYETTYAYGCLYTHCDASTLDRYLDTNANGEIRMVGHKSLHQDIILSSLMAANIYHRSFELFSDLIGHETKLKEAYVAEYQELQEHLVQGLERPKS